MKITIFIVLSIFTCFVNSNLIYDNNYYGNGGGNGREINSNGIFECIKPYERCNIDLIDQIPCSNGFSCQIKNESNSNNNNNNNGYNIGGLFGVDNINRHYNEEIYICKERKRLGQLCTFDSDCQQGYSCYSPGSRDPLDQVCIDYQFAYVGEECQFNHQCHGNLKCINSKCTNTNVECYNMYDCQSESYCNSVMCDVVKQHNNCSDARCTRVKLIGESCLYNSDCALNTVCANRKCIEKYSLREGDTCFAYEDNPNDQCDISKSLICKEIYKNEFKCVPRDVSTTNNCRDEGCLYDDEICEGATNKCVTKSKIMTQQCKNAERNRNECYLNHKCAFTNTDNNTNLSKRSCALKYCYSETIEQLKQCDRFYSLYNSCKN